jgi:hypothetical protein
LQVFTATPLFAAAALALGCTAPDPGNPVSGAGTGGTTTPPGGAGGAVVSGGTGGASGVMPPTGIIPSAKFDCKTVSDVGAEIYLRKLAPMIVQRVLTPEERAQIKTQKGCAIEPILAGWTTQDAFVASSRRFLEESLQVSGMFRDVDFDIPGNMAAYLVKNKKPWSNIITSDTCYDKDLNPHACDTGAPYSAGVLTTRAFIGGRTSRFNLSRASAMLLNFACRAYPMEDALQPRMEKPWLQPLFQANSPAEQTDPRGATLANNGFGCYICHGQFSVHAQFFVKFDGTGLWQAAATGIQDPVGELGRSLNGLMASHLKDPERAGLEGIQMFGKPAKNLAEAARIMVDSPTFIECAAKRYLDYFLGVPDQAISYDLNMFPGLGERIRTKTPNPTLQEIVMGLFTDPSVVRSVIAAAGG